MTFESKTRKKKAKQARLLDLRVEHITNDLTNVLFKELSKSEKELNKAETTREILNAIGSHRAKITNSEIESLFAQYVGEYKSKVSIVREALGDIELSTSFDEKDAELVRAIIEFDVNRIRTRVDSYLADINAQIFVTRNQGVDVDIASIADGFEPRIKNNLNTEVTTNIDAFERTITVIQGQKLGIDLFLYVGGLIQTSRDFCKQRDGKIYSWAEIQKWDNGQGLPASIYLGGYNCRHHLAPISREIAQDEFGYTG